MTTLVSQNRSELVNPKEVTLAANNLSSLLGNCLDEASQSLSLDRQDQKVADVAAVGGMSYGR